VVGDGALALGGPADEHGHVAPENVGDFLGVHGDLHFG